MVTATYVTETQMPNHTQSFTQHRWWQESNGWRM